MLSEKKIKIIFLATVLVMFFKSVLTFAADFVLEVVTTHPGSPSREAACTLFAGREGQT